MPDALHPLTDADRDDALHLAHDIVESVRVGRLFPIDVGHDDQRGEVLRMAQYLVELADPSCVGDPVDQKFDGSTS